MQQALSEEMVAQEVLSVRIIERQRALYDAGRVSDAEAIARSLAAVTRVQEELARLHPHPMYTRPGATHVNGPMHSLARRADDR